MMPGVPTFCERCYLWTPSGRWVGQAVPPVFRRLLVGGCRRDSTDACFWTPATAQLDVDNIVDALGAPQNPPTPTNSRRHFTTDIQPSSEMPAILCRPSQSSPR